MNSIKKIQDAVLFLYRHCDGASSEDNVGFNGRDVQFGHSLAIQIENKIPLTERQLLSAYKMLKTYRHTQLEPNGLYLPYDEELEVEIRNRDENKKINDEVSRKVKIVRENIRVFFNYDEKILSIVKSIRPKGAFKTLIEDGKEVKFWTFPMSALEKIHENLTDFGFEFDETFKLEIETINYEKNQAEILKSKILKFTDKWIKKYTGTWKFSGKELVPYNHQIENIKFLASRTHLKGAILADDMGLGKTFSACLTAKFLKDYHKFDSGVVPKIFVICPKSLKDDWVKAATVTGLKIEVYTWGKIPTPPESKKYIVIADESHYAQNWGSKRTQNFIALCRDKNCLHAFPCTGTPMKNGRPANIYPLLAAINHPISRDKREFEKKYCNAHPTAFTNWDITGAAFLEELSEKISDGLIRHTKEQCLDLPEKIRIVKNCECSDKALDIYDKALQDLKDEYKQRVLEGKISNKGQAIVFLGYLRRLNSILKVESLIEDIENLLDSGESVVVFTEFKESAKIIADRFSVQPLTGEMNDADRQQLKEDFQAGKTKIFVGTIKAGGVGITLTKACYNLILDYPWTPGDLTQAEDRIHRIGQNRTSFIYNYHAKDIDLIMAAILGQKSENIDKVLVERNIDLSTIDDDGFYEDLLGKLLG